MPWNLDNNRPIYLQIMEKIQKDIVAGVYAPGDRLPSVHELALEHLQTFLEAMNQLGFSKGDILSLIQERIKEGS